MPSNVHFVNLEYRGGSACFSSGNSAILYIQPLPLNLQTALMVKFDWWMDPLPMKGESRSAEIKHGGQFVVTTIGVHMMPMLYVASLDTFSKVRSLL